MYYKIKPLLYNNAKMNHSIFFRQSLLFIIIFLLSGGCQEKIVEDPCLRTKWPQTREYEIKLAVHIKDSNPQLPGAVPGSQYPSEFDKMLINGTIEKFNCTDQSEGPISLGNTYLFKGITEMAPIDIANAYWIGHVVYVYEFGNDRDRLTFNLNIKITMKDNQSYVCNISEVINHTKIFPLSGEMYYYILFDIYSDQWIKV